MGLLGNLLGAAVDIALTPVEIVKDITTVGGALNDQDQPYTIDRLGKAFKKVSDAANDASDGELF